MLKKSTLFFLSLFLLALSSCHNSDVKNPLFSLQSNDEVGMSFINQAG
jgi:hypothetical protein